ncbi:MAG: proton-conducting membrane transporter [Candidatus Dormibacteraeota bacterium]|nr:proton-conducting membrane transporter [Candidatus Dormibacteraeota bacterium]
MTLQPYPGLLDGPPFTAGAESLAAHQGRLGSLPTGPDRLGLIERLEASGLQGRGGAGFPVGRKWRSVAERSRGRAVVLANGAEGEPLSAKDRTLMAARPHLILDGAGLAADAVGADKIVLYVGQEHRTAAAALEHALEERSREFGRRARLVRAPLGYVSGEETAAVHYVNEADARPTSTPPRPFESGVSGRTTLVQNVESLALTALIARFGDGWYRAAGRGATAGSALVTVSGPLPYPGVREIGLGTTVGEVAAAAGQLREPVEAVLLGGYFGAWAPIEEAWRAPLDPAAMRAAGLAFGCGVVAFLPGAVCGVTATARILRYLAAASSGQCGPCVFGLAAVADATARLAGGTALPDDLDRLNRWCGQLAGRGACRHPDGAGGLLQSALRVFGAEFAVHQRHRRCKHGPLRREAA